MVPEPSIRSPPIPFNGVETGRVAEYMASRERADQALNAVAPKFLDAHSIRNVGGQNLDGCVWMVRSCV